MVTLFKGNVGPLGTSRSFRVIRSTPVFHHSTDGYIGQRDEVVSYCGTLQAAWDSVNALFDQNNPTGDPDDVSFYVADLKGFAIPYDVFDFVNSYYVGPVDLTDIPF